MPAFAILAMITYLLSLGLIIPSLVQNNRAYRRLALLFAAVALISHAVAHRMDMYTFQDQKIARQARSYRFCVCLPIYRQLRTALALAAVVPRRL